MQIESAQLLSRCIGQRTPNLDGQGFLDLLTFRNNDLLNSANPASHGLPDLWGFLNRRSHVRSMPRALVTCWRPWPSLVALLAGIRCADAHSLTMPRATKSLHQNQIR